MVQVVWVIFTSNGDASRFDMYGVVVVTELGHKHSAINVHEVKYRSII